MQWQFQKVLLAAHNQLQNSLTHIWVGGCHWGPEVVEMFSDCIIWSLAGGSSEPPSPQSATSFLRPMFWAGNHKVFFHWGRFSTLPVRSQSGRMWHTVAMWEVKTPLPWKQRWCHRTVTILQTPPTWDGRLTDVGWMWGIEPCAASGQDAGNIFFPSRKKKRHQCFAHLQSAEPEQRECH